MKILIAGSSGGIGSALISALEENGHEVVRLVRPTSPTSGIRWDPTVGQVDLASLEGFDAVVNLAGRSIGQRRWTDREKELLSASRVEPTRLLAESIAALRSPPAVLLNASAVGFYGDRGDERITEETSAGQGFMSALCAEWETATEPAIKASRVVRLRSGVVFSGSGGVLGRILAPFGPRWLSPFRWGLGGVVGRGRQGMPWISMRDEVAAIVHLLSSNISGPVNLVSPQQVTHRMFIKALGKALGRPTVLPIPPFVIRMLFGSELAGALVDVSQHVVPDRLMRDGFQWSDRDIEIVLRDALS